MKERQAARLASSLAKHSQKICDSTDQLPKCASNGTLSRSGVAATKAPLVRRDLKGRIIPRRVPLRKSASTHEKIDSPDTTVPKPVEHVKSADGCGGDGNNPISAEPQNSLSGSEQSLSSPSKQVSDMETSPSLRRSSSRIQSQEFRAHQPEVHKVTTKPIKCPRGRPPAGKTDYDSVASTSKNDNSRAF
eukprot:Filipodium_phascolosomae@DN6467_c0_g1_i1.p1